jgi:hypothetical protein
MYTTVIPVKEGYQGKCRHYKVVINGKKEGVGIARL